MITNELTVMNLSINTVHVESFQEPLNEIILRSELPQRSCPFMCVNVCLSIFFILCFNYFHVHVKSVCAMRTLLQSFS